MTEETNTPVKTQYQDLILNLMMLVEDYADSRVDQSMDRVPPAAPSYEILQANDRAVTEARGKVLTALRSALQSNEATNVEDK